MIKFRKAAVTDSTSISELVNSAYRGDSSREGWTTEADMVGGERTNPADIAGLIQEEGSHFILAEGAEGIVGCVHTLKEDEDTLYFGMLAVNPKLQAKGTGKKLINEVKALALDLDLKRVRITVISIRPELIQFYNRLGFQFTGKEEPFSSPEHALVKDLKFIEMICTLRP